MSNRTSVGSDSHERLEPRLLRAVEHDRVDTLQLIVQQARGNGQLNDNLLHISLMRAAQRGCTNATEYLLSIGANTNVPSNRVSPLLKATERNHVRIVQLLLDYGASPDTTVDKEGRTVLMTAAWKNHWHVLQLLITRGADVNVKDARKRNVLHNLAADKYCDWGQDVVELLLKTDCKIDGDEGRDELGRTPLHWACATRKIRLAEMLLTRPLGPKADVDAVESRNKTSLHIAAAHGWPDIVDLLLRHNADVNARSDGGWTPLHNACQQGNEQMVRSLLRSGSNVNSQLLNGATPLHLAAESGHTEVVECLLEQPNLKRRVRDNFGSTAFLRAAQFRRKDVVQLLAPFNNVDALSADAKGACEGFEATIVDFGNFHNCNRVQKTSVFNLLYGKDEVNPNRQAWSTILDDGIYFRWIHLPANNMAWVEALLTKAFIEEGANDVEGFKGLEWSLTCQHRGRKVHSHFMRPLCQNTPRATRSPKPGLALERRKSDEVPGPQRVNSTAESFESKASKNNKTSKKQTQSGKKLQRAKSVSQFEDNNNQAKNGKNALKHGKSKGGPGTPRLSEAKTKPPTAADRYPSPGFSPKDNTGDLQTCNVCLFMPYLHFESAEGRRKMQQAIQAATLFSMDPGRKPVCCTQDEMLIRAHLASSTISLHVRRTLDQFFYPNIDTQSRDQDQVVYRYQTQNQGSQWCAKDPKIFMVDQLWMWILGKNLIVTSFPQRWDQPKNDPLNVLDGIIEDINSKTRERVQSVHELATIITNRCSGIFDRHRMGDEEYQFLDMFESSIGTATDRETKLFEVFNAASVQASYWLKSHHRTGGRLGPHRLKYTDENGMKWLLQEEDGQPRFIDKLLDIGHETNLLAEARDIRDELNMIRTVLQHQQHVLADFQEVLWEIHYGRHRLQHESKKRFKDQQRTIDMHLKDIDRMDKQAERIYSSITDLLDLKQKYANALEARFARDQAVDTTRQGKTIMMFTIVTIIFLPLSFIMSIFTVNISEFPHASDGSQDLHLSYVAKYTFGIGFAISIPLIILALTIDDIGLGFQQGIRRLWKWTTRRRQEDIHHQHLHGLSSSSASTTATGPQLSEVEFTSTRSLRGNRRTEKGPTDTGFLGNSHSHSCSSSDFGPSLLPVSTADTPRRDGLRQGFALWRSRNV